MRDKLISFFQAAIASIWGILCLGICLVLLLFGHVPYYCKQEFLLPDLVLLLLMFALLFIGYYSTKKIQLAPSFRHKMLLISGIFFILQFYVFSSTCFWTETWDAHIISLDAQLIARNSFDQLDHTYFSWYPNNQLLVFIFSLFFRVNDLIGSTCFQDGVVMIILFQCLLSTIAGYLTYQLVRTLTGSEKPALLAWLFWAVLVGCSGWNIITYSDSMTIAFPIALLSLYQSLENGKKPYLKWFLIFTLTFWGGKLKPTVYIPFIAILAVELVHLLRGIDRSKLKRLAIVLLICVISVGTYTQIYSGVSEATGLEIDPEANLGTAHWLMMGLNEETDGVYYGPDVEYSTQFPTKAERTEGQLALIKERLSNYGLFGLAKHTARKALVNFNDGTFAWGMEGGFYDVIPENVNLPLVPILRNLIYNSGAYYPYRATIAQMAWLFVFFTSFGMCFLCRDKQHLAITLSLIGLVLFNLLFEARARYVYIFAPVFIVASAVSIQRLVHTLPQLLRKCKSLRKPE